ELENQLYKYQESEYVLELTKEQIALTEQAASLMTTNYAVANTGVEELVRQRQALIAYKQQQIQAITDQHIAVSAINRLMNLAY
ncbi:MAG: TolC family protein, partial [Hymenobacteraceae bacterium]|nr:TolC family protein [Hymenobacteraceae bacterium]MDX5395300.1 TolC family protein [Hymenobacteraceae bacterium]MDX5511336.1 TolC family protein [Hymenobacteraceae bacterium]